MALAYASDVGAVFLMPRRLQRSRPNLGLGKLSPKCCSNYFMNMMQMPQLEVASILVGMSMTKSASAGGKSESEAEVVA
jgi:hypothetical protein